MIILLIFLAILVVHGVKGMVKQPTFDSYLSVSHTQAVKGLFVIIIFFSHFCSYVHLSEWYDIPIQKFCRFLGQLMVVPFLFYSGYGIYESVKKKGNNYLQHFTKKRILKTLLHFDFAILLFLALDLVIGKPVSISQLLLSLIAWDTIGNSNWFIFAILCAYLYTFVSLVVTNANLKKSLVLIVLFSLFYIFILHCFKDSYWYDTILAFPLGCSLSLYKKQFETFFNKKYTSLIVLLTCIFVIALPKHFHIPDSLLLKEIMAIIFSLGVVLISLHISLESKILNWFGTQVFGVYILQRFPMNFLTFFNLNQTNVYLFFVISFLATIVLATLFKKATDSFDNFFLSN